MRLRVRDEADLTQVVLEARHQAKGAGFGDIAAGKLATAVSELGRNILKYAGQGDVRFVVHREPRRTGIEVVVRDRGPGIIDVDHAMEDRYSSSGTLGLGLPGVRRLMDEFSIESEVGRGTTVVIRKWESN